jgi:superfamily II DNA or RNA helicase
MDIINEVQEAINDGLSPKHIKKYVLKNVHNEEYCDILIENCKFVENIYKNFIIKHIELPNNNKDIDIIKKQINRKILKEPETNDPLFLKKIKMIKYLRIINDYIEQTNFIQNYINDNIVDTKNISDIDDEIIDKIEDEIEDEIIDEIIDEINDEIIDEIEKQNNKEDNNPTFELRPNQIKALQKNKDCGFISGIHIQVTGAGKSLIILKTISDKLEYDNSKKVFIILTDRIEILKNWFFDSNNNLNQTNVQFWKDNNIIDLTKFDIIDTVANKDKNIINKINYAVKPTLVIMNNAFLRTNNKYEQLINNISLVLLDECHCVSGPEIYKALRHIKNNLNTSIIGFSATPIRNNKNSILQLCEIFGPITGPGSGHNKKINILSFYDIISALQDDIILPYKFVITSIKNIQNVNNKLILKEIINKELELLPYKKVISWCKRINDVDENVQFFKDNFPNMNIYYSHSDEQDNNNVHKFYTDNDNAIMLCVNRFREGCDINHLDCGIYLDQVKKRSTLVSIQTSGRVVRPDKEKLKKYGLIIENIYFDSNTTTEYQTVQRIAQYYEHILNISDDTEEYDIRNIIDEFKKIYQNTIFSPEKSEITIKVDDNVNHDNVIKVEIKDLNWGLMKKFLNDKVIIKLKKEENNNEKLKLEFELLRDKVQKLNLKYKKDYYNLDEEYEKEPDVKYNHHGWLNWYDFLGIDTSNYPALKQIWRNKCIEYNLKDKDVYDENCKKYNLPLMPEELYKDFKSFYEEFTKTSIRK